MSEPTAVYAVNKETSLITLPDQSTIYAVRKETDLIILPQGTTAYVADPGAVINTTPGLQWQIIAANTQMQPGNGYAVTSLSLTQLTLPAQATLGQTIKIYGLGMGGWRIAQNAGQYIQFGNKKTTTGTTGFILSLEMGDYIELTYLNAWTCAEVIGNLEFG